MSLVATAALSLGLVACRFGFAELLPVTERGNADGQRDADLPDASVTAQPDAGPHAEDAATLADASLPGDGDAAAGDGGSPFDRADAAQAVPDAGAPTEVPVTFTPGGSTPRYGGDGGTAFSESCPAGYAIVGYQGFESTDPGLAHILGIQAQCGRVSVASGSPPSVTVSDLTVLAAHGGNGGDIPWERRCPADQMVVGFAGRADASNFVNQLVFYCAPLVAAGSPGSYSFSVGTASALPVIGTSTGGTAFGPANCPAGQVVMGDAGQSGFWIDAFELSCGVPAAPSLNP